MHENVFVHAVHPASTSLEDCPRYTPTSCFETFPFPNDHTPAIPDEDILRRLLALNRGRVAPPG